VLYCRGIVPPLICACTRAATQDAGLHRLNDARLATDSWLAARHPKESLAGQDPLGREHRRPGSWCSSEIHYFRPDLLGLTVVEPRVDGTGTHTDFRQPSILIYEPQADGSLELVAIENLVFKAAWEAAGRREPPSFNGTTYYQMVDDPATPADEAHMFEPHYDLHIWLYRDNPNGVFAQFNPAVTCEHQPPSHQH
jgi:hypothetical protein